MDPRKLREGLRKQGIYVRDSDPILEMAAICYAGHGRHAEGDRGSREGRADRSFAAAAQTVDASRKAGDALINQGASFLVEQFREVAREATAIMLAELRRETAKAERASRPHPDRLGTGQRWRNRLAGIAGFLLAASYMRDQERIGGVGSWQATPHSR